MLRRMFVLAVAVVACVPAAAAAAPRIVGGQQATKAYPYAAFVELHYPGSNEVGYCGGTLIAARYVVTAGHCLEDLPNRIDVAVGVSHVDHNRTMASGHSSIPAADQYLKVSAQRDPAFGYRSGEPVNDVAILTLPRAAPQQQLRLPRPGESALWAPGTTATAIGWGKCGVLELSCGQLPDDLREVALPVISDASCQRIYDYDPGTELCAGGQLNRDTCNGDSGSPLIVDDGFGQPVLAGATSYGAEACGNGDPAAYSRLGGSTLNDYVRAHVPQVEIDASDGDPVPGETVVFTARPDRPGGSGPFGGYDAISWDLNGDGVFGEEAGQLSVQRTVGSGTTTVAVRATDGAGDAEVRTVRVATVDRASVAFARARVKVVEGHAATLTLTRLGVGGGSVTLTPSGRPARGARTVAFSAGQTAQTVRIGTRNDRRTERTRHFTVALGGFTGSLQAGSPAVATVTVLDDDPAIRARALGAGRLRVKADRAGRFTLRGAGLRTARVRLRHAGSRTVRLRRHAGARTRVRVSFDPTGVGHPVTVHAYLR